MTESLSRVEADAALAKATAARAFRVFALSHGISYARSVPEPAKSAGERLVGKLRVWDGTETDAADVQAALRNLYNSIPSPERPEWESRILGLRDTIDVYEAWQKKTGTDLENLPPQHAEVHVIAALRAFREGLERDAIPLGKKGEEQIDEVIAELAVSQRHQLKLAYYQSNPAIARQYNATDFAVPLEGRLYALTQHNNEAISEAAGKLISYYGVGTEQKALKLKDGSSIPIEFKKWGGLDREQIEKLFTPTNRGEISEGLQDAWQGYLKDLAKDDPDRLARIFSHKELGNVMKEAFKAIDEAGRSRRVDLGTEQKYAVADVSSPPAGYDAALPSAEPPPKARLL